MLRAWKNRLFSLKLNRTDISTKKKHRWQISEWNNGAHHVSSGRRALNRRPHCTPVRVGGVCGTDSSTCWCVHGATGPGGNEKRCSHVGRPSGDSSRNWTLLPYDPAVGLSGIYLRELKMHVHRKVFTQMFIAALFIIAKTWKQPSCPSMREG